MDVKVSICCIAYNQVKYICQCLDGFLMQKTNFPFEVLIHDDCSTDGTKEIIERYAQKYPNIIKPLYEQENQHSKNITISTYNYSRVSGEYVAICEGDDYWTDPCKLQKQVDFMDKNIDYSICFHNVERVFETGVQENDLFPTAEMVEKYSPFNFENLLQTNFIQTNSVMYRWSAVKNVAENFPSNITPGDWYVHLMFAKVGKIKFLEDIMSVYRVNENGIWYNSFKNPSDLFCKNAFKMMKFYESVYKNLTNSSEDYFKIVLCKYRLLQNQLRRNKKFKDYILFTIIYRNYECEKIKVKIIEKFNKKDI